MPIRGNGQPVDLITKFKAPGGMQPVQVHTGSNLGGGMVTTIDPADIKDTEVQLALNMRTRFDKASRRFGSLITLPAKPNVEPVIHLGYLKLPDSSNNYNIRISPTTVHYKTISGAWIQLLGGNLLGAKTDLITDAVVILPTGPPYYVFANNGKNEIQKADFAGNTFGDLRAGAGVSTKYRYITGFYNRVFGFALAGTNECQIGWSGDGNITVFDPAVDATAGNSPLIDSPDDESDFISGGVGFTNIMIIMRNRSIWHGTKLPIPQQPIYFYCAIPGIGCDCPGSLVITTEGLCWVDTRTATVWSYVPGKWPTPIGRKIEKDLINSITNPNLVFASYNAQNFEYSVCIIQSDGVTVLRYTYNFRNSSWVKDIQMGVSCISDAPFSSGGLSIAQLVGTIGGLVGSIGNLGSGTAFNGRIYGMADGTIQAEYATATMDGQTVAGDTTGVVYESDLVSKVFQLDRLDQYITQVRVDYVPNIVGNLTLWYSKSGGAVNDWIAYKTITTTSAMLGIPQIMRAKKQVKTRRFAWKLSSTMGQYDLLGYEVHYFPGAESRV